MEPSVIARSASQAPEGLDLENSTLEELVSESSSSIDAYIEPQLEDRSPSSSQPSGIRQEIQIFLSTFFTIFLAELGDKTQLTTLLMSAESDSPWIVFLGAGSALVATSLLGILVGHWLSKRVSARTLETSAAAMLTLISVMLLWDVIRG